jgi:hypothetical protein
MPTESSTSPFLVRHAGTDCADLPMTRLLRHVTAQLPEDVHRFVAQQGLRFLSHDDPSATDGLFTLCDAASPYTVHFYALKMHGRSFDWLQWTLAAELSAAWAHFGFDSPANEIALRMLDQCVTHALPLHFRTSPHARDDLAILLVALSSIVRMDPLLHVSPLYWSDWAAAVTRLDVEKIEKSIARLTDDGWLATTPSYGEPNSPTLRQFEVGPASRAWIAYHARPFADRARLVETLTHWFNSGPPSKWVEDDDTCRRWPHTSVRLVDQVDLLGPDELPPGWSIEL